MSDTNNSDDTQENQSTGGNAGGEPESGWDNSGDSSGGSALAPAAGGVNPQVLDAVSQSTTTVMSAAPTEGAAVAYQKVAQAASFAVQDATDYQRNVENIAMTAQGVIITKMLEDQSNIPIYTPVLATLQEMVVAASTNLATVGSTAAAVVSEFPSKA